MLIHLRLLNQYLTKGVVHSEQPPWLLPAPTGAAAFIGNHNNNNADVMELPSFNAFHQQQQPMDTGGSTNNICLPPAGLVPMVDISSFSPDRRRSTSPTRVKSEPSEAFNTSSAVQWVKKTKTKKSTPHHKTMRKGRLEKITENFIWFL